LSLRGLNHEHGEKNDPCVQIPTQAGHLFRFDRGHPSDLKPATIPI
jgi:hypothetical protein